FTAIQFVALLAWSDVFAGSATWALNPVTEDWETAVNWVPNTVPDGPDDVATFGISNLTAISVEEKEVNSIVFNPGASAYTINSASVLALAITGAGVINESGTTQNFVATEAGGHIVFNNHAS